MCIGREIGLRCSDQPHDDDNGEDQEDHGVCPLEYVHWVIRNKTVSKESIGKDRILILCMAELTWAAEIHVAMGLTVSCEMR